MSGLRAWAGSWRLALRMGFRDARRNKARSLLVAVMVGLPVMAGAAIDVAGRSAQLDPQDVATVLLGDRAAAFVQRGEGRPLVQAPDNSGYVSDDAGVDDREARQRSARIEAALPAGHVVPYRVERGRTTAVGDRAVMADLVEVDYDDPLLAGWAVQRAGRAPAASGEVAVTEAFVRTSDVQVGESVVVRPHHHAADGTSPGPGRSYRVVGIISIAGALADSQLLAGPGSLLPQGRTPLPDDGWFVDAGPVTWPQVQALNALGARVVSRAVLADPPPMPEQLRRTEPMPVSTTTAGIVTVAGVLVLLQITLLAGPALAVGARRNQRGLAVVASAGGSPAMLRRAVLASGVVVGLSTSVVGVAAGLGVVAAARGWLERTTYSPLPRLDVHLLDLALVVAVGTGTALAAAVVPALHAGRLDVVAALAGRRGQAAPRRRVAVVGVALVGTGLATAVYAAYQYSPFVVSLGLALGEFGLVALSGTLVALAARVAPRLPLASRLALRDAARQRGRTAPAVAAVIAVVAGCSAVAVYAASQERLDEAKYRPITALGTVHAWTDSSDVDEVEAAIRATMPVAELRRLAQLQLPGQYVEVEGRQTGLDGGRRFLQGPGGLYVDDGAGMEVLLGREVPAMRAALRAGRTVVFDRAHLAADGTVGLRVEPDGGDVGVDGEGDVPPQDRSVRLPATFVDLPLAPSQPVMPPSALPLVGKDAYAQPSLLVASTTRMPTDAEEQRLVGRLPGPIGGVERGYRSPYPVLLLVILIASVVVALGSTLAVVGLSAAEGRADVATLAAVGAAPRVRRRLAAAQAGVVAVLGTVLGCVSGVVSGATLVLLSRDTIREVMPGGTATLQVVLPWRDLGLLAVALPVLAVVAAALLTRSRLPMVRRLGQ